MVEYKTVPPQETEMTSYGKPHMDDDPTIAMKPPKDFEDGRKEQRKNAKEVRISISILILTFLASACIVFGTLFPELSRGEVDMRPFRDAMYAIKRMSPHLVKDRITLVNLGLWRYCYDDQLYDLIEIINPGGFSGYKKKRDVSEEEDSIVKRAAAHSVVKRQKTREGDLSIRCHPVPAPWKMPYHVKYKTEIVKVTLLIGIVTCVISFLVSILVLITRLPLLKLFLVFACFCGVVSIGTAIGVALSTREDGQAYINEQVVSGKLDDLLSEMFGVSLQNDLGIILGFDNWVVMEIGISGVLIMVSAVLMAVSVVLSELGRHYSAADDIDGT